MVSIPVHFFTLLPHCLYRLLGAWVVQVTECGDFEPADLVAVVGMVAAAVPEQDVPPERR
jgi:hypothetical protein